MALTNAALMLVQAGASQAQIDRIVWSQIVMAIGMGVITLAILALAVGGLFLALSVRKLVKRVEGQVKALAPRAEPLLTAANKVATDATGMSAAVKERVDEVLETVKDVNQRLRALTTDAEERVREFGAVLDVVQGEAREVLLDAAATARGVHTTAEMLQAGPGRRVRPARETESLESGRVHPPARVDTGSDMLQAGRGRPPAGTGE